MAVPAAAVSAVRTGWARVWADTALLRSRYDWVPTPQRQALNDAGLPWFEHDALAEQAIERWAEELRCQPLDIAAGPCMRLDLCAVQHEDRYLLVWTCHQILLDPDSMATVLRRVWELAEQGLNTPADWAEAPFAEPKGTEAEYWARRLQQLEAAPRLPWSEPGAANGVLRQQRVLSEATRSALTARWGAELDAVLHAAWAVMLCRHGGTGDVVFGHVGRAPEHRTGVHGIGMLSDLLPFRVTVDDDAPFTSLVEQVGPALAEDVAERHIGLAGVWRAAGLSHDAMFTSVLEVASSRWSGLPVTEPGFRTDIGFPLHILVEPGQRLVLTALVEQPQFNAATAERLLNRYARLLDDVAQRPEQPVADLAWWTPEDTASLAAANNTVAAVPHWPGVDAWFRATAEQVPEQIAIRCGETSLSYRALDAAVNDAASALQAAGLGGDQRIALATRRSESMVVGLLAIWRIGAAYVPCDPRYPSDRLLQMWEDGAVAAIVTESAVASLLPSFDAPRVLLDRMDGVPANDAAVQTSADAAAYVIFTSGSTGRPKGIEVTQRNVLNFLTSMQQRPGLAAGDRLLAVTTMSFDIAVLELFLPLVTGATVVLANEDDVLDGHRLAALIDQSDVNVLQATPTTYRLLLAAAWRPSGAFRALVGGEALDADLAGRLRALHPALSLWNMYGPTETTVWSTCDEVAAEQISIGAPIANTRCHVVDAANRPLPPGVIGELCIGGAGVTNGYFDQPERTAERFVDLQGERVYRTGDLACWRDDGRLQCFGRLDFQIKIRGYRVEPGEIEACLVAHPQVEQAVVVVREQAGLPMLVAYVVSGQAPADRLRDWVAEHLPPQMVPATVIPLGAFPLTPNGKVDRKALPPPATAQALPGASLSGLEAEIGAIWRDALGHDQFAAQDSFFDLGGDSLRVMEMLAPLDALARREGGSVSVADVFRLPTIARLADHIRQQPASSAAQARDTDDRASRRRAAFQGRRRRP